MDLKAKQTAMQYRTDKKGYKISILGYGCMHFSKKGNSIDLDKAENVKSTVLSISRFVKN